MNNISLPIYLDSFFIGIIVSIISLIIGSALTHVTEKEKKERDLLFVMPESEQDSKEIKKTKIMIILSVPMGICITLILLIFWVIPYLTGLEIN